MGYLKNNDYDDTAVRHFVKKIFESDFNIKLKDGKYKKIDLVCEDNPHMGVEVERGGWEGDFWSNEKYCMITKSGFPTINIPQRKEHYWKDINGGKKNLSALNNIFVRTNRDFSQFIIVRPEVIRDLKKMVRTMFIPSNNKNKSYEEFMSFRREDTETYNLVNEKFILEE